MDPTQTLVTAGKALAASLSKGLSQGILALAALVFALILFRSLRLYLFRKLTPLLSHRRFNFHAPLLLGMYLLGLGCFAFILQFFKVNLSTLALVLGALSVGIGFGLQSIVGNFVSGLFILLERPVKIGDRIILEDKEGTVVDLGIRATTVLTNEGVSVIIPNTEFITRPVINRSQDAPHTRFKVPVGVAYGSDPREVERILLEVAARHPAVMQDPPPQVIFEAFGESSLRFFLWAWTDTHADRPMVFRSELNFAIHEALQRAGIRVPFPQVDVHLRRTSES